MPLFRIPAILIPLLLFGFQEALAGNGPFDGLWGVLGARKANDSSASTVEYHYSDQYVGSLNPPGFQISGQYNLQGDSTGASPSMGLLYVSTFKSLTIGLSATLQQHVNKEITMSPMAFTTPTNSYDRPQGYVLTTNLTPTSDFSFAFEPGFAVSNSFLVFLRASYHKMEAVVTTKTKIQYGLIWPVVTEASDNGTFYGSGFGGGIRIKIGDGLFIEPSYEQVTFQPKSMSAPTIVSSPDEIVINQSQTITPKWTLFSIVFGSRF